ncbi:MAG TPA: hypothetical protein VNH53_10270 [Sphingomicrobium sp.]|nr:hypothetical protein [Sphingomicrobium sp.]
MRKLFLAAGVAALAIATPAVGKPDKAGGDRGPKAGNIERGGGGGGEARAQRAQVRGDEARGNRGGQRAAEVDRRGGDRLQRRAGQEMRLATMQARGNSEARGGGNARSDDNRRVENRTRDNDVRARGTARNDARARGGQVRVSEDRPNKLRAQDRNRDSNRIVEQRRGDRELRVRDRDDDRDDRRIRVRDGDRNRVVLRDGGFRLSDWDDRDRWTRGSAFGLIDGCPPGLAKKNNGCLPPGQAKKMIGSVLPAAYASHALPRELRYLYPDTNDYYYRYGDGYAYRVDRQSNLVSALLPLIGAGLGIGQPFPYSSPAYHVPSYYQPFYPATDRYDYRYANGYIYEIDRFTGEITDIIPQYDHGYGVGQMLPASYSYYNLPQQYRQWYVDDDDYYYRYAPGSIYRVDRETNLITSIVSLLAGGLGVGQPLPMGYDVYNVPFAYRDRYYDTPDAWYRYGNGNIYQVDPTTRLITAIVQAIV